MTKIRIGGVPEHFNLPIHLANEKGLFEREGLQLEWVDYPGGSGYMKEALRNGDLDLCILLTEGIVADIINGNPSKIISGFVKTSLTWGIHTALNSEIESKSIFNKTIAISRLGSGSHLMPIVHATMEDTTLDKNQFVEIGDVHGGIEALKNNEAEVFYWEKYTTKPLLEKNGLKRIGEFISPWPCFMIAATNDFLNAYPELVVKTLDIIHESNEDFMKSANAAELVSRRYNQELKDAKRWFHSTEWSTDGWVSNKMLEGVLFSLKEANVIPIESSLKSIIWERKNKAPVKH